jgi:hypothetical protein
VPLRSHGSLSLNRALMAAGLVDHVQVTLFPVITDCVPSLRRVNRDCPLNGGTGYDKHDPVGRNCGFSFGGGGIDRPQVVADLVPVLPRGVAEGVADQMQDARLDGSQLPDAVDRVA